MAKILSSLIFALAIIITSYILSDGYKNRNIANQTISVTGLGSMDFNSDLISWTGSFSKKSMNLKEAYLMIETDRNIIRAYLETKGINKSDYHFDALNINKDYDYSYDDNGRSTQSFTGYRLTQNLKIESKDVEKIESLSREITEIIDKGVEFYSYSPQYFYTELDQLKINIIAQATEDARIRAETIALESKAKLGKLMNTKLGVFQITAQNSSEEFSWGGTYNTYAKNKTARVTVKADYAID